MIQPTTGASDATSLVDQTRALACFTRHNVLPLNHLPGSEYSGSRFNNDATAGAFIINTWRGGCVVLAAWENVGMAGILFTSFPRNVLMAMKNILVSLIRIANALTALYAYALYVYNTAGA